MALILQYYKSSMNIAITLFGSRIAPRFDMSQDLLVVSVLGDNEIIKKRITLVKEDTNDKIREIASLGISTLICGAVTQFEIGRMVQNKIEVVPGVTGEVEEVLDLLLKKQWLPQNCFWNQSFCGRKGWKWKKGCNFFKGGNMPRGDGTGPAGQGCGTGRGLGRSAGNVGGGMGIGQGRGMGRNSTGGGMGSGQGKGLGRNAGNAGGRIGFGQGKGMGRNN